jgi:hypothetical protein
MVILLYSILRTIQLSFGESSLYITNGLKKYELRGARSRTPVRAPPSLNSPFANRVTNQVLVESTSSRRAVAAGSF